MGRPPAQKKQLWMGIRVWLNSVTAAGYFQNLVQEMGTQWIHKYAGSGIKARQCTAGDRLRYYLGARWSRSQGAELQGEAREERFCDSWYKYWCSRQASAPDGKNIRLLERT